MKKRGFVWFLIAIILLSAMPQVVWAAEAEASAAQDVSVDVEETKGTPAPSAMDAVTDAGSNPVSSDDTTTDTDITEDPVPDPMLPAEESGPEGQDPSVDGGDPAEEPTKEPVVTYEHIDATIPEGYYSIHSVVNDAYALDVDGASPILGTNVQLYPGNATPAQTFYIHPSSNEPSTYTIETTHVKNMAIDVAGGKAANKTNIQIYTSNHTAAQRWVVKEIIEVVTDAEGVETRTPTGRYTFLSAANTAFALDVSNGTAARKQNVQLYAANNTTAQQWTLVSMPEPELPKIEKPYNSGGIYRIVPKLNSGMSVDIRSGSLTSKALVQLYKNNNTNAQKFVIRDTADGFATIQAAQSGLVLNVKLAKETNKQSVWQYRNDGTKACKWTIEPTGDGDGSVYIRYANTNFMLDVPNGSATSKKALYIYRQNGTDAQKFYLVPTNYKTGWQNHMGFYRYLTGAQGSYQTSGTKDGFQIASNGHSTAAKRVHAAQNTVYNAVGRDLRRVYMWCVERIDFVGNEKYIAPGFTGPQYWGATAIENRYGHCYHYAAAFTILAQGLGYNAKMMIGQIRTMSGWAGHAWVEIRMDGGTYVFDPTLQHTFRSRNGYHFSYGASGTYQYRNGKAQ